MSLYSIKIGENEYHVNLEGKNPKINGKPASGNLRQISDKGLHILQRDNRLIELYLNSLDGENLEILIGSQRLLAKVETSRNRANHRGEKEKVGAIIAPMPGVLVRVLVKVGDYIERNQTVAVLESMKMQMQLRAQKPGMVVSIIYQAGEQVAKGKEIIRVK